MLCRLLKNGGYLCAQAENGQECVDLMVQNREENLNNPAAKDLIQIVFMDFEMPIMKGPDAAKALRDLGFTVPIIGVTGNVLPVDKAYFISKGANEVLCKPLYIEELNTVVRKYSNYANWHRRSSSSVVDLQQQQQPITSKPSVSEEFSTTERALRG
jgi:CheY-like chemotaxis protein